MIVVAGNYFGIWGIIVGFPVVAMVRDMAAWETHDWNRPEREAKEAEEAEDEVEESE